MIHRQDPPHSCLLPFPFHHLLNPSLLPFPDAFPHRQNFPFSTSRLLHPSHFSPLPHKRRFPVNAKSTTNLAPVKRARKHLDADATSVTSVRDFCLVASSLFCRFVQAEICIFLFNKNPIQSPASAPTTASAKQRALRCPCTSTPVFDDRRERFVLRHRRIFRMPRRPSRFL